MIIPEAIISLIDTWFAANPQKKKEVLHRYIAIRIHYGVSCNSVKQFCVCVWFCSISSNCEILKDKTTFDTTNLVSVCDAHRAFAQVRIMKVLIYSFTGFIIKFWFMNHTNKSSKKMRNIDQRFVERRY